MQPGAASTSEGVNGAGQNGVRAPPPSNPLAAIPPQLMQAVQGLGAEQIKSMIQVSQ